MSTHTVTIDATKWSALVVCTCGWRGQGMTRREAWALAGGHTMEVAAPTPTVTRKQGKKP